MKVKKRKKSRPADKEKYANRYAMFSFRLSPQDFKRVEGKIKKLLDRWNEDIDPKTDKKFLKSHLALESLELGLKQLEKIKSPKR